MFLAFNMRKSISTADQSECDLQLHLANTIKAGDFQ